MTNELLRLYEAPGEGFGVDTSMSSFGSGYDAGARSVLTFDKDFYFTFAVMSDSPGIVAGVSSDDSGPPDPTKIPHGVWVRRGWISIVEYGKVVSRARQLPLGGAVISIGRKAGRVYYAFGAAGEQVYIPGTQTRVPGSDTIEPDVTQPAFTGVAFLEVAILEPGDGVYSAAGIDPTGVLAGNFQLTFEISTFAPIGSKFGFGAVRGEVTNGFEVAEHGTLLGVWVIAAGAQVKHVAFTDNLPVSLTLTRYEGAVYFSYVAGMRVMDSTGMNPNNGAEPATPDVRLSKTFDGTILTYPVPQVQLWGVWLGTTESLTAGPVYAYPALDSTYPITGSRYRGFSDNDERLGEYNLSFSTTGLYQTYFRFLNPPSYGEAITYEHDFVARFFVGKSVTGSRVGVGPAGSVQFGFEFTAPENPTHYPAGVATVRIIDNYEVLPDSWLTLEVSAFDAGELEVARRGDQIFFGSSWRRNSYSGIGPNGAESGAPWFLPDPFARAATRSSAPLNVLPVLLAGAEIIYDTSSFYFSSSGFGTRWPGPYYLSSGAAGGGGGGRKKRSIDSWILARAAPTQPGGLVGLSAMGAKWGTYVEVFLDMDPMQVDSLAPEVVLVDAEFLPLTVTARSANNARAEVAFMPLTNNAARQWILPGASVSFPMMTSSTLPPKWEAATEVRLPEMLAVAFQVGYAVTSVSLGSMWAQASGARGSWAQLAAPRAVLVSAPVGVATAALTAPSPTLFATARSSTGENDFTYTAPKPGLSAFGGATAKLAAPSPTLSITATVVNLGHAALQAPSATLSAAGTVSGTAYANLTFGFSNGGSYNLIGYGGAVASITLTGSPTVQATGTTGSIGGAQITAPLFELTASGTAQNRGSAILSAPPGALGATAQAWLMAPRATLTAIGTAVVTATFEAYAVNLNHTAKRGVEPVDETTRYTNFPFTHVVRYRNSYFGANSTGLYLLEGTTDAGADINYALKTTTSDLDSPNQKTVASAYFSGRLGPDAAVTLYAGEGAGVPYTYTTPRGALAQNHRQVFGKGIKQHRYYSLGVAGSGVMELDGVELDVKQMNRRI